MRVSVIREAGFMEALVGMGLSFEVHSDETVNAMIAGQLEGEKFQKRINRAFALAGKGGGHDKFMRQIMTWIYIKAPFYWWKQMDQYKVATTTSSESTMHTLGRRELTQDDFEDPIDSFLLDKLNVYIACGDWDKLNNELPSGFLQGRMWTGSYANIYNIVHQRGGHKLKQWDFFINSLKHQLLYPKLIWNNNNEDNS